MSLEDSIYALRREKIAAIEKLGQSRSGRALDELTEAIQDKDEQVRVAAVTAIGLNSDLRSVMILVGALNPHARRRLIQELHPVLAEA